MIYLDEQALKEMVAGGAVLGSGGGGTIEAGLVSGRRALTYGKPRLGQINDIPNHSLLLTLSVVGPVKSKNGGALLDWHQIRALELIRPLLEGIVGGIIPSEVGPQPVTYGWLASAITGIPIIDAPANGRAHPLALMGSLGIHRYPKHMTYMVAVGGKRRSGASIELSLRARTAKATRIIRDATAGAGFPLAVVRNPLPAAYVRCHAALGGLVYARRVGRTLLERRASGLPAVLEALTRLMGGRVLASGRVNGVNLDNRQGFTVGNIVVCRKDGRNITIPVCNEFMMAFDGHRVRAVFPDLIAVFAYSTALPLTSSAVKVGQRIAVFVTPRKNLILGSPMSDNALLKRVESILQISLRNPEATYPSAVKQARSMPAGVKWVKVMGRQARGTPERV